MPICIECRFPVSQLYHVLHSSNKSSKKTPTASEDSTLETPLATQKTRKDGLTRTGISGLGEVRLMQCPRCKRFADKYVEHDFVVLFIDLVLVKPQVWSLASQFWRSSLTRIRKVYRHLLFNRLGRDDDELDVR